MTCPFCNSVFPINDDTIRNKTIAFKNVDVISYAFNMRQSIESLKEIKDAIEIQFSLCPSCDKHSIKVSGLGHDVKEKSLNFVPSSLAKKFPDYIPKSIRNDYEESCKIVNLSPKASATLSRRCLQGMIRDYWKITNERSLYHEIDAIKEKVDPQVWKVLDSVRQIGNIGAHMEKDINLIVDIDPGEAEKLIKLIEYLIEQWYIKRYETDELLNSIVELNTEKQEQRKS